MGFSSRFFVALLALCVVRGVWASCNPCDNSDDCGPGYEADYYDTNTGLPYCVPCECGSETTRTQNCEGFTVSCPGMTDDVFKCKESQDSCDVSGCTRYDSCEPQQDNQGQIRFRGNVILKMAHVTIMNGLVNRFAFRRKLGRL